MQTVSKKVNIVLLTDCLADLAGGAEKQIFELAKRLDKNRYNVLVVSLDCVGKASSQLIESIGCRLIIFRVVRVYGFSGLRQGLQFLKFLKQEKVDMVMTYHFSSDMWGTFWSRLAGVPVILSNRRDMGFWRMSWHVAAYRIVNRWVKKIVVVSESVKNMVIATEHVAQEKIEVIYNGVELSPVTSLKRELEIKDDEIVIMHVANLKPVKGHTYFLQAVAQIINEYPKIKIVLIGKDEFNGAIQKQAKELGIEDKIIFLGQRNDVGRLLSAADICVLPSVSEGMSNAILEYMAAGKPVIATRVGGNPELVQEGFNGLLVAQENVGELKNALIILIKDENKRKEMGSNGFKRAQEYFSMNQMVVSYDKLFTNSLRPKTVKLLHLVSSGGLFGAERVILNLAGHNNNGTVPIVGALRNYHNPHLEIIEEARKMGLRTVIFNSYGQFDLGTVGRVTKFLKDNDIDIIHTHNYKSDIIGFLASRLANKKWIATNHVWHNTDAKLKIYERMDAFVLKFAHKVLTVSDEIKNDLITKRINNDKVKVIYNGIDISLFDNRSTSDDYKHSFGIKNNDIVVAIVGRLSKEKGHHIFLRAAKEVSTRRGDIKFLIVGDGPLKEILASEVKNNNLTDKVVFTGVRNDMPQVYSICDILVNSSFIEGLPITILEAMASKVCIIATRVGAVPQVIRQGENGILLDPGDDAGLTREICALIDRPELRNMLADQAHRDVCEHFSVMSMVKHYSEIYKEVLGSE